MIGLDSISLQPTAGTLQCQLRFLYIWFRVETFLQLGRIINLVYVIIFWIAVGYMELFIISGISTITISFIFNCNSAVITLIHACNPCLLKLVEQTSCDNIYVVKPLKPYV